MIEFFDSYGLLVDDEQDYVDDEYKEQLKENYRYLTQLIYESPYELEYNPHTFQKAKSGVNTCGRWVVYRYRHKNMHIDDFYKALKGTKNKDQLMVRMVPV